MAEWYIPGLKRGRHPLETWEEFTKDSYEVIRVDSDFGEEAEAAYVDAKDLGTSMLEMYLEEYGLDDHLEVIAPEQRFKVLIPDPTNPQIAIAENVGTFDAVVRNHRSGHVEMMDHKTCKGFEFRHLTIDDQGGSYCALATHALREQGLIKPKESVRGIMYNFLRKQMRDTRPRNAEGLYLNKPKKEHYAAALAEVTAGDERSWMKSTLKVLQEESESRKLVVGGDVSKVQPKPIFLRHFVERTKAERNKQITRIGTEVQIMNRFRSGELPLYKNPTKDCPWECDFFELCELDEANGDVADLRKHMFKRQDPYHDHRDGADNSKTSVKNDQERKVSK